MPFSFLNQIGGPMGEAKLACDSTQTFGLGRTIERLYDGGKGTFYMSHDFVLNKEWRGRTCETKSCREKRPFNERKNSNSHSLEKAGVFHSFSRGGKCA
jgi:hypothetical protein